MLFTCPFQHWYIVHTSDPIVHLGIAGFILAMFSIGLAIGVIIAVGTLFVIQVILSSK